MSNRSTNSRTKTNRSPPTDRSRQSSSTKQSTIKGRSNSSRSTSTKRRSDFERKKTERSLRGSRSLDDLRNKREKKIGKSSARQQVRGQGGGRTSSRDSTPKIAKEKKKRRSKLAKFFSKMCGSGPKAADLSLSDEALRHVERAGLLPDEVRRLKHCFSSAWVSIFLLFFAMTTDSLCLFTFSLLFPLSGDKSD